MKNLRHTLLMTVSLAVLASACSQKSAQIQFKGDRPTQYASRPQKQPGIPFQPVFDSVKDGPKAPTQQVAIRDLDKPSATNTASALKPKPVQIQERVLPELASNSPSSRASFTPLTPSPAPTPEREKPVLVAEAPKPFSKPAEEIKGIRNVQPDLSPSARNSFIWPVQGSIISAFGPKSGGLHNDGVNIAAPAGSDVYASMDGTVIYVGDELKSYGNLVIIRHENGWMTAYAHNDEVKVKKGDMVHQGDAIATVGRTGNVSVPQVHFAIRQGKKPLDPVLKVNG